MVKMRRPRIGGLMGSDLYKLTLCLICVCVVVSDLYWVEPVLLPRELATPNSWVGLRT